MRLTTKLIAMGLLLLCSARPSIAGPLDMDATAIAGFTGSTTFQGTVPVNVLTDLVGYVDYAVYAPGVFQTTFPLSGYVPTLGEYVYAYQIYETGAAPVSSFSVNLLNPANNLSISFFSDGGVNGDSPSASFILPVDSANWLFDGIPGGGSSKGLVFSSPFFPTMLSGNTIDHGSAAAIVPLPSPSNSQTPPEPGPNDPVVPEPSTFVLAFFGLAGMGICLCGEVNDTHYSDEHYEVETR